MKTYFSIFLSKYSGPPLKKLSIRVGGGPHDGTYDWVQLMFRNNDGETCKTGYLNYNSYGFSFATRSRTTVLDSTRNSNAAAALGECGTGRFRPDGGLWMQVIMTRHGWNAQWDGYAFSGVQATFGDWNENGGETVWSYNNWNPTFCDGCNGGYSSWFRLTT